MNLTNYYHFHLIFSQLREANGVGQAAVVSTAQLQARVTQSNEAVGRLSNENRQLTGS